jgi:hypothetical protein
VFTCRPGDYGATDGHDAATVPTVVDLTLELAQ